MRSIKDIFHRSLFLGLLSAVGVAWADCVETVGLTPSEHEFYLRANAVLKSLLPPPPVAEGMWHADGVNESGQIEVCKGDKRQGNFSPLVTRKYVWPDPKKNMADAVVTLRLTINSPKFDSGDDRYAGSFGSPSPTQSAALKVQNIAWELSGSSYGIAAQVETLRASLATRLERERMGKLVGRPLPSVAESETLGRKVAPTTLLTSAPVEQGATQVQPTGNVPAQSAAVTAPVTQATKNGSTPTEPVAPSAVDAVKDVADSVQKLRALFGR